MLTCMYASRTYLKLALSIHIHPSFTTQRISSTGAVVTVEFSPTLPVEFESPGSGTVAFAAKHGIVRSGNKNPLSL